MVTFANLGYVRLPSLKFAGFCNRKIQRIQCVSCLSTTVSQLFEPQLQKIVIFRYLGFHFLFALWGRPCGNHAKRCMNERQFSACQTPCSMYPSIFNSFPVIRTVSAKKLPFSHTAAHIFVFPGDAPVTITQYVVSMERQFNACQTPCSMYLSIFNSFRVIRCLSRCISPKIAIFTTFLFPLGTPLGQSR